MTLLLIGTLLGLAGAALAAVLLGGALGAGALSGFALAALLGLAASAWQVRLLRRRPARAFSVFAIAFLLKLAALLVGTLLLRYLEPIGARADWRGFALGFAAGVLWLSVLGPLALSRGHHQRRQAAL